MKNLMCFFVVIVSILFLSNAIATDKVVVIPLFSTQAPPAPVEKTGQDTCFNAAGVLIDCAGTRQDGNLQVGVDWPAPRFTDHEDGTITDRLTSLIWLKSLGCNHGDWQSNLDFCNSLAAGTCNLTDSSEVGDWRLANRKELLSLIDHSQHNPALPAGHPFTVSASANFISSTTSVGAATSAWIVGIYTGASGAGMKTGGWYGTCVRSDQ